MAEYDDPGCRDPTSCDYDANATGFAYVGPGACRDESGRPGTYIESTANNISHCIDMCIEMGDEACFGVEYSSSTLRCELYSEAVGSYADQGSLTMWCYKRDNSCIGPPEPNRDCDGNCLGYLDCASECFESIASEGVRLFNRCGMCTVGGNGASCTTTTLAAVPTTTTAPRMQTVADGAGSSADDFWVIVGVVIAVCALVVGVTIGLVLYFSNKRKKRKEEELEKQRLERKMERQNAGRQPPVPPQLVMPVDPSAHGTPRVSGDATASGFAGAAAILTPNAGDGFTLRNVIVDVDDHPAADGASEAHVQAAAILSAEQVARDSRIHRGVTGDTSKVVNNAGARAQGDVKDKPPDRNSDSDAEGPAPPLLLLKRKSTSGRPRKTPRRDAESESAAAAGLKKKLPNFFVDIEAGEEPEEAEDDDRVGGPLTPDHADSRKSQSSHSARHNFDNMVSESDIEQGSNARHAPSLADEGKPLRKPRLSGLSQGPSDNSGAADGDALPPPPAYFATDTEAPTESETESDLVPTPPKPLRQRGGLMRGARYNRARVAHHTRRQRSPQSPRSVRSSRPRGVARPIRQPLFVAQPVSDSETEVSDTGESMVLKPSEKALLAQLMSGNLKSLAEIAEDDGAE
eukprot:INCI4368.1.p1 GENE.INCI4368.1~~INCI4368.1.p1  ORF type:complete len:632 (+),score=96.67 INCI4368.1:300-2195(+)